MEPRCGRKTTLRKEHLAGITRRDALRASARALVAVGAGVLAAACGGPSGSRQTRAAAASASGGAPATAELEGTVLVDGSSTVAPISQAVAEEFQALNRGVRVPVGTSGTGGGFKKFCLGETDISDASRPVKGSETETCEANGIGFIELPVAFDGLAVLVNPQNSFVDCLTVAELRKVWEPAAEDVVTTWSQVRDGLPDDQLILYGPGVDSGTYDYFTEAIVGEEGASRGDFTPSEDDNVLVTGIANDRGALGYFGYAYYAENADRLKLVPVDGGDGCVLPTDETIHNGSYSPLSRPLFIYVSSTAMGQPHLRAFVEFYLDAASRSFISETGYIPFQDTVYGLALAKFHNGTTGAAFGGDARIYGTVEEVLRASQ